MNQKILFFSPHSAIWVHAFPEALIAESLQKSGCEIRYVTCSGLLGEMCVSMSAYGLTEDSPKNEKNKVCKICTLHKNIIKKNLNFNGFDLKEKVTNEIINKVKECIEFIDVNNFLAFEIDGIQIGKLATYEFFLNYKINSTDLSSEQFKRYKIHLRNCLLVYFVMDQYIRGYRPTQIVCYNNLYSVNSIVCKIANKFSISCFSLHGGLNWSRPLETLLISQGSTKDFLYEVKAHWDDYKNYPCSAKEIKIISNYILSLTRKSSVFVYSSQKSTRFFDLKNFFGIHEKQKILVATMSSCDEKFSDEVVGVFKKNENLMFRDQVEWIQFLINEIKNRDDLFLIIRVHPREFPNAREKVKSSHALLLAQIFQDLPNNIAINWPDQNISLYDLADIVDVFLNAWSSAGVEMSALGFPVVIYSQELSWAPKDLFYIPLKKSDYMNQVDLALHEGWSFEKIRKTYRWINLSLEKISFDISDSFSYRKPRKDLLSRLKRKFLSYVYPSYFQKKDFKRRANVLMENKNISELFIGNKRNIFEMNFLQEKYKNRIPIEEETKVIKNGLMKFCDNLYNDEMVRINSKLYHNILEEIGS